jgi:hypothetical protein
MNTDPPASKFEGERLYFFEMLAEAVAISRTTKLGKLSTTN